MKRKNCILVTTQIILLLIRIPSGNDNKERVRLFNNSDETQSKKKLIPVRIQPLFTNKTLCHQDFPDVKRHNHRQHHQQQFHLLFEVYVLISIGINDFFHQVEKQSPVRKPCQRSYARICEKSTTPEAADSMDRFARCCRSIHFMSRHHV